VTNLARPDGNITGVSVDAGLGVYDKRLQFLSETVRNLRNVRVLIPSSAMMFWETGLAPLREAAGRVGIRIAAALLSEKLDRQRMSGCSMKWKQTALTVSWLRITASTLQTAN
jgi:putative ABC transport system substrate-binding protein